MLTDTELKLKGLKILSEALGAVEAEKFVALIMWEPFDYTKWQKSLWLEKTVEEVSADAMKHRRFSSGRRKGPRPRTAGSTRRRTSPNR